MNKIHLFQPQIRDTLQRLHAEARSLIHPCSPLVSTHLESLHSLPQLLQFILSLSDYLMDFTLGLPQVCLC